MTENKPTLEFVNDWGLLQSALEEFNAIWDEHCECDPDYCDLDINLRDIVPIIVKYVPALIEQYGKLFELSETLTSAWEAFSQGLTPAGLIVPEL